MKTLFESILKSVKAGMHSVDPKNIKTVEDLHEYAKFLYGDKVKDIVNRNPAKYFWIMYNEKLVLRIYTTSDKRVQCIFELSSRVSDNELYWSIPETYDEADFETLLRPEKLLAKDRKYYEKLAKKYQKKADKYRHHFVKGCVDKERAALEELWAYEKQIRNIHKVQMML